MFMNGGIVMKKYRSKQIETIEAEQFILSENSVGKQQKGVWLQYNLDQKLSYQCRTLSGMVDIKDGDYIIYNREDDEYYPCDEKTFNRKYALIE